LGEGLYVVDDQGCIVFSNPAASSMLGWTEAEMHGAPGHQLIHGFRPDGSHYPVEECPLYRALKDDQALADHEDAFVTKDGRHLPVSITMTTMHRAGRVVGAVLTFQDITRRKQAEAELQRYRDGLEALVEERTTDLNESNRQLAVARDRAETANLAKSTFLANMSHELRTPLSAILGFSQLLEMGHAGGASGDNSLCVDHILRNGKHLLALINDLLDLAKIDVGQVSVNLESVSVGDLMMYLEAVLVPMAEASGLTVHVASGQGFPDVRADRTRLNQVLLNLGTNAVKYNSPGGRVGVTCEQPTPMLVRITVSDTGQGIPEARLGELFEPFNRLGREAGVIEGTGIGLTLARKLMETMGGNIGFSTQVNEGSQFWIDIPVHVTEAVVDASINDLGQPSNNNTTKADINGTILCIDDSRSGLELVAQIVAGIRGASLLTADNAEAGITLAQHHQPNIILMDINLPGMNGFEALTELRKHERTRGIPVFALSSAATVADIERGLAAGFDCYLTKPYDVRHLMTALADVLSDIG
jgi:PAS domain S-box-containing protein